MGQTKLYQAFKNDLGQTPHEVLTRIRMRNARRMLRETDHKLGTVALECGLGDPVNLFRQFKRRLDKTPAEYRQEASKQKRSN